MRRTTTNQSRSTLTALRALSATNPTTFAAALRIAENQATALRQLTRQSQGSFAASTISAMPHIRVARKVLPVSGISHWDGEDWRIYLNRDEPLTRQRFSLLHEYKHIVDHGYATKLYTGSKERRESKAEQAADYFAGCVLMPASLLKGLWLAGLHSTDALARHFGVSVRAVEVRLGQLGLLTTALGGPRPQPADIFGSHPHAEQGVS